MENTLTPTRRNRPNAPREKTVPLPGEEWKKIEDAGNLYYCSNLGRFRKQYRDQTGQIHDFILHIRPLHGSMNIALTIAPGNTIWCQAGRVLLQTWHPEIDPSGKYLYYRNGDYTDLRIENLYWATKKEIKETKNILGVGRTKLVPKFYKTAFGEVKSKMVMYSDNEKEEMRRLYSEGWTQTQIAEHFNGSQAYVSKIIRRLA